jgi:hypothetical protein
MGMLFLDTFEKLKIDTDSEAFRLWLWKFSTLQRKSEGMAYVAALNPVEYLAVSMREC